MPKKNKADTMKRTLWIWIDHL